jgi:hypothetical protein
VNGSEIGEDRLTTYVLHLLLLTLGEVEHLSGVLEEDGSLGLGLGNVESAGVDSNLHVLSLLDDTCQGETTSMEQISLHYPCARRYPPTAS